jgi:hypothetical protein
MLDITHEHCTIYVGTSLCNGLILGDSVIRIQTRVFLTKNIGINLSLKKLAVYSALL